jgi:uncharacterized protein YndB with AHSA1/START domain
MPDILHQFPINATLADVFEAISTPEGIDVWWTNRCKGNPAEGSEYELFFAKGYDWRAVVSEYVANQSFELTITHADADWTGVSVGFDLAGRDGAVEVRFYNRGWATENDHYRISNYCWAMYLRLLRRYVEHGEVVEYEHRLKV